MVIAPIDQNDIDIGSPQSTGCSDPGKAAAHDHDALSPSAGHGDDLSRFTTSRPCFVWPRLLHVFQRLTHGASRIQIQDSTTDGLPYLCLNCFLSNFPTLVFGSLSTNRILSGIPYFEIAPASARALRCALISFSPRVSPAFGSL